jgi:molecular chaperone GrpE
MAEKEYEIPVKVVDRRRWADSAASSSSGSATGSTLLKPTYVEQLEEQLAQKDREAQEYLAKYRKAATEFDEARLRLRREISKDIERVRRDVIAEMLDVLDNLDRAIDSASRSASNEALLQGVEMVRRQFLSKLEGLGVHRIDAAGQPFDPTLHEAITTVPASSSDQAGLVVGVIRHGYRIGDQVLRPATVAVAKMETQTPAGSN